MPNMRGMGGMGSMGGDFMKRGMSPDFNMKRGFGANMGAAANKRAMDDAPMTKEKKSSEDERNFNIPQVPQEEGGEHETRGMDDDMAPMMRAFNGMMSPQNAKRGASN